MLAFLSTGLVLDALSAASSIVTLDGWVRGLTNARDIRQNHDRIESLVLSLDGRTHRIDRRIERMEERIFREISTFRQELANGPATDLERGLALKGHSVIRESAVPIPEDLQASIDREPRRFLHHIHDAAKQTPPEELLQDPHLVACPFVEEGRQKIGFANIGLLEAMGIPYRPLLRDSARSVDLRIDPSPLKVEDDFVVGIPYDKTWGCDLVRELSISQIAEELDTPTHVLRFWESKFDFIRPQKLSGGRRVYSVEHVIVFGSLKSLLHDQGYTISGINKVVASEGVQELIRRGRG